MTKKRSYRRHSYQPLLFGGYILGPIIIGLKSRPSRKGLGARVRAAKPRTPRAKPL